MYVWHIFDSVEAIEPIISSTESFCESMIAGEVFVLQLEFSRFACSVVHVVGSVNSWPYIKPMFWVFVGLWSLDRKLSSFHELFILRIRVNPLLLELLLNKFAFDKSLWFFKVIHGLDDFCICRNNGSFDIILFGSGVVENPWRTILSAGGLVESIFSGSRKSRVSSNIHMEN